MTLGRRAFLATASGALATGIACEQRLTRQQTATTAQGPSVATLRVEGTDQHSMKFLDGLTTHFLQDTKYGRFDMGSVASPAAWINVYGLAALIVKKDRASAKIHFPKSPEHVLTVWYLDGNGKRVGRTVEKSLVIKGLGGSLVLHDAAAKNIEHPYDDLGQLADNQKLGLGNTTAAEVGSGYTIEVTGGHVFGGRSYAGHSLLFRTETFADLEALRTYSTKPTNGNRYSLTDNFNWLSPITSKLEVVIDDSPFEPGLEPIKKSLRCVCITHDSQVPAVPNHVLGHSRHFARLVGGDTEKIMKLPVFMQAQMGESEPKEVWDRNSEDPICNGRIIWES